MSRNSDLYRSCRTYRTYIQSSGAFVVDYLYAFECDQAVGDQAVEHRQERLHFFETVHDLDDHRQVFGETQDLGRVQNAVLTETHHTAQHRGAGKTCLASLQHDHFVERFMAHRIAFADKDSKQVTFFRNRHAITFARL